MLVSIYDSRRGREFREQNKKPGPYLCRYPDGREMVVLVTEDDADAFEGCRSLEDIIVKYRWPDGVTCPKCHQPADFRCPEHGKFHPWTGTIFEYYIRRRFHLMQVFDLIFMTQCWKVVPFMQQQFAYEDRRGRLIPND